MSDLFAMSDAAADQKLAAAAENSVDSLSEMESPLWRGTGTGLGMGFMRGFAKVADAAGIALGGTGAKAIDRVARAARYRRGGRRILGQHPELDSLAATLEPRRRRADPSRTRRTPKRKMQYSARPIGSPEARSTTGRHARMRSGESARCWAGWAK
jgi:hypothetical protein